jgi:hypothetical protein
LGFQVELILFVVSREEWNFDNSLELSYGNMISEGTMVDFGPGNASSHFTFDDQKKKYVYNTILVTIFKVTYNFSFKKKLFQVEKTHVLFLERP